MTVPGRWLLGWSTGTLGGSAQSAERVGVQAKGGDGDGEDEPQPSQPASSNGITEGKLHTVCIEGSDTLPNIHRQSDMIVSGASAMRMAYRCRGPQHTGAYSSHSSASSRRRRGRAGGEAGKRARNLQKKLRQIQQLKEKAAGGAALEPEQLAKIGGEAALLEDLRALGEDV